MNSVLTISAWWPVALLVFIPLLWWLQRHSATNLSPGHLRVVTALRTVALTLLVGALMRPVWQAATEDISVVYALDVSRSVSAGYVDSALKWIRETTRAQSPASARYVAFADRAVLFDQLDRIEKLDVSADASASGAGLQQGATDIEAALDEALLGFESQQIKRLVLLSDGNQTQGNVWRLLPRLQADGVRVYVYPATPRAQADAWIEAIEIPPGVRRDEPVTITVRVASQKDAPATVRLLAGQELGRQSTRLKPGLNSVDFITRLRRGGAVELSAEVKAEGDLLPDNDRLLRSFWVGPRARVLYAEGQTQSASYLRDALSGEGVDVRVVDPAELPARPEQLAGYDAVIVSDVPRESLSDAHLQALRSYVRDAGGGLIYAGGVTTYGKDGFSGTPLEAALPVEFKAQEKRKDLALMICLDRSYSMKGRSIELAKAATRAALGILEEQHEFGVIAFDSQPHEAVPLQQVRSKRRAEDLIDRIQASGQTNIYAALGTAFRSLQKVKPQSRHVILLSDGDTAPADFERLLKRMTDAHITVSTVTIGTAGDRELMEKIARWGRGRAYIAEDVAEVPQIFVEDAQNAARATLIEEPFRPVVKRKVEALRGLDFAHAPPLSGFASTKPREGAEVFLESESGAPILARWQYGLGRSAVFTSDVKNRWASAWLQWEGYGKFWGQLTRDVMRRDSGEAWRLSVRRESADAQIELQAQTDGGGWENGLSPTVRIDHPNGASERVQLHQTGPGFYRASLEVAVSGSQPLTFQLEDGGGITRDDVRRAGVQRLYYPYPDEYRSGPPDTALLQALAEHTGGKLAPATAEIFEAGKDRGRVQHTLWPWFALAALLVYALDIALRRGLGSLLQRYLVGARVGRKASS